MMDKPTLFTRVRLGAVMAANRLVMAPFTRMRTGPDRVATPLMARYYAQRASAGLIVAEATAISQQGTGCLNTPGIYNGEQVIGWQRVTKAVQQAGGHIFVQLRHMGRISSPAFQPRNAAPVAPSAIPSHMGYILTKSGIRPPVIPRALEEDEMPAIVEQYSSAAKRAMMAGFDGIEIDNANGYLLDQFLRDGANFRTDSYGGSVENRARLTLQVIDAVAKVCGPDRVGICFSPGGAFNDMYDSNPLATFRHVLRELSARQVAYVHIIVSTEQDLREGAIEVPLAGLRQEFPGPTIVGNGFDRESAAQVISDGLADAVSFGRLFVANPDLPARFRWNAPLNTPDVSTFYVGGERGYTDYPALVPQQRWGVISNEKRLA